MMKGKDLYDSCMNINIYKKWRRVRKLELEENSVEKVFYRGHDFTLKINSERIVVFGRRFYD